MGANESREAETELEERKNGDGGFFSKALTAVAVAGTAAILAGGAEIGLILGAVVGIAYVVRCVAGILFYFIRTCIAGIVSACSASTPGRDSLIPTDEKLISWKPPSPGWMKINTDGSEKNGEGAAGGLLRDSKGQWVKGFTFYIGPDCTPVIAELFGVIRGLELAWKAGCRKLEVETDNEGVEQMINNKKNRQNDNYKLVSFIRQLLKKDWEVKVLVCERKQNRCADKLASYGFEEPREYQELSEPPTCLVSHFLEQDSMGKLVQ